MFRRDQIGATPGWNVRPQRPEPPTNEIPRGADHPLLRPGGDTTIIRPDRDTSGDRTVSMKTPPGGDQQRRAPGAPPPAGGTPPPGVPEDRTVVIRKPGSGTPPVPPPAGDAPQPPTGVPGQGSDRTVVMRAPQPGDRQAGSEDATVAMPIMSADAPTMAMPIQKPGQPGGQAPPNQPSGHVVAPGRGAGPLSKPPSTPRSAPGPKQPGQTGPGGPQQGGPAGPPPGEVENTRPTPPPPPGAMRPTVEKAPSPADTQLTSPVQSSDNTAGAPPRPVASPQRIAPPAQPPAPQAQAATEGGRSKRWLMAAAAAVALLLAGIVAIAFSMLGGKTTPQDEVRTAIGDYANALRTGDLAALRSSTCGPLHDFYAGISEQQFAGVHRMSAERKSIPIVDGVGTIAITGDTAIAEATVYTEADPSKRSARTFDLEQTADGWKVCDPTTTTP